MNRKKSFYVFNYLLQGKCRPLHWNARRLPNLAGVAFEDEPWSIIQLGPKLENATKKGKTSRVLPLFNYTIDVRELTLTF